MFREIGAFFGSIVVSALLGGMMGEMSSGQGSDRIVSSFAAYAILAALASPVFFVVSSIVWRLIIPMKKQVPAGPSEPSILGHAFTSTVILAPVGALIFVHIMTRR